MFLALALVSATAAQPRELDLSSQDKYALLSALSGEVGGGFIVTGIANAESVCASSGSCLTGQDIVKAAKDSASGKAITSVDDLIARTRIKGKRAASIVNFRAAQRLPGYKLRLIALVYDPLTRKWTNKAAVLESVPSGAPDLHNWRRLLSWGDTAAA